MWYGDERCADERHRRELHGDDRQRISPGGLASAYGTRGREVDDRDPTSHYAAPVVLSCTSDFDIQRGTVAALSSGGKTGL